MSTKYKIRTIQDLLKVPAERRTDCLMEIEIGLRRVESICEDYRAKLPRWLHWLCAPKLRSFIWIDDGLRNETVRFNGRVVYERVEVRDGDQNQ